MFTWSLITFFLILTSVISLLCSMKQQTVQATRWEQIRHLQKHPLLLWKKWARFLPIFWPINKTSNWIIINWFLCIFCPVYLKSCPVLGKKDGNSTILFFFPFFNLIYLWIEKSIQMNWLLLLKLVAALFAKIKSPLKDHTLFFLKKKYHFEFVFDTKVINGT